jgi:hypothetical protein
VLTVSVHCHSIDSKSCSNSHIPIHQFVDFDIICGPVGEEFIIELTSLQCSSSSPMSLEPEIGSCNTTDQEDLRQVSAHFRRVDSSSYSIAPSQSSSNSGSISVLSEISPNVVGVSSAREYTPTQTPSMAPTPQCKESPSIIVGKRFSVPNSSRLKNSTSASQLEKKIIGSKRPRGKLSQTQLRGEVSILKFFKPTQKKLAF